MQNNDHVTTLFSNFLHALVKNWTSDLVYQKDTALQGHVFLPDRAFFDNFAKNFEAEIHRNESAQNLVEGLLELLPYPNKAKCVEMKESSSNRSNKQRQQKGVVRELSAFRNVIGAIEEKYPQAPIFRGSVEPVRNVAEKHQSYKSGDVEDKNKDKRGSESKNENGKSNNEKRDSVENDNKFAVKNDDNSSKKTAEMCEPIIDFVVSRMLLRILSLNKIFFFLCL
ncbi:hypothetical protein RFI_25195 [Reticulomyxa filosa]|uniref:Uncharacterized protein n=1 Tax=Reticulomyxa filosa TaxID=46433 RepID=X6ME46_RETFI|nr:hypothetical protein RFI_25195 [Reticulomyxa filosa]|eukprot:ETO12179.1 hypothetical protein RFI_25195 [Reticulomyxa filosa]